MHTDRLKWPVAKQWEQQQSKSLITEFNPESSIYNKESKKSYQKRLVCGLPGPQQRRELILPGSGVQNRFSYRGIERACTLHPGIRGVSASSIMATKIS